MGDFARFRVAGKLLEVEARIRVLMMTFEMEEQKACSKR